MIFKGMQNRAALAPMAGVADRAMRELCMTQGASFCCGEMVSAKGVSMGDRKSARLMALAPDERPAGIQLFGREPACFRVAARAALQHNPDFIDINMGCPAPKIAGQGGGAALMREPGLAEQIVLATADALRQAGSDIPVSVKLRAGWDEGSRNAVELAKRCEAAGAAWITVHGRTRQQMYAPPVDVESIRAVKEAVSLPVIGNGDVTDGPSAAAMLEAAGCDMVMVGRGAMGRPWVFRQIEAYLRDGTLLPEPGAARRMRVMLEHVRLLCEYKGDTIGMREARKHAAWYIKGLRGAARLRAEVVSLRTMEELREIAERVIAIEDEVGAI
ncbi:MAG: tRNA dihydrouridine synthase DusB [Oscillospiraceae bacterium]|nr:tRNA dihydrouridine synthase DusB [Oscillospiraceae bacterium]